MREKEKEGEKKKDIIKREIVGDPLLLLLVYGAVKLNRIMARLAAKRTGLNKPKAAPKTSSSDASFPRSKGSGK